MTGLTRREVSRIEALDQTQLPTTRSAATEVLTHWVSLPGYTDDTHRPIRLPRHGNTPSFEALAKSVTRDVHPRSLLEDMVRLNLVAHDPRDDTVTLLQDAFVPRDQWAQMIGFLGSNVGDHLQAAVTNVLGQGTEHFEQSLLADELSVESIQEARELIAQQWRQLMTGLAPRLQALMNADQAAGRTVNQALRIGLYSWAHPMPTTTTDNESTS